jgi:hypothetical protein
VPLLDVKLLFTGRLWSWAIRRQRHTYTHIHTEREQYIIRIMHDNLLRLSLRPALIVFVCADELDFFWLLMTLAVLPLLLLTRPHSHQLCIQWRHSRTDSFNNVSFWGFPWRVVVVFLLRLGEINTPTDICLIPNSKSSLFFYSRSCSTYFKVGQSAALSAVYVRPSAVMACS